MHIYRIVLVAFLGVWFAVCALGQTTNYSEAELIDKLVPTNSGTFKTRGLRNLGVERTTSDSRDELTENSVSLVLTFDFNSSNINSESYSQLDSLAAAINSQRLIGYSFKIEGHTDAKGPVDYNKTLSQKRAISVKNYLVGKGVNPKRLKPEGMGLTQLANSSQPYAEENRRVVVKTIFNGDVR